jgi:hypothetical protein
MFVEHFNQTIVESSTSDLYCGGESMAGYLLPMSWPMCDSSHSARHQNECQFIEILIRCSDAAVALGGFFCSPYMRLICGCTCTDNALLLNDDTLILCITHWHSAGRL